jgi:hypothetical protein
MPMPTASDSPRRHPDQRGASEEAGFCFWLPLDEETEDEEDSIL